MIIPSRTLRRRIHHFSSSPPRESSSQAARSPWWHKPGDTSRPFQFCKATYYTIPRPSFTQSNPQRGRRVRMKDGGGESSSPHPSIKVKGIISYHDMNDIDRAYKREGAHAHRAAAVWTGAEIHTGGKASPRRTAYEPPSSFFTVW